MNNNLDNLHKNIVEQVQLATKCGDKEKVLSLLRENSLSKIESIHVLMELFSINFKDSKDIVHSSKTWSDYFEDESKLNDDFLDFIDKNY